jgi:hypothetical protein
MNAPDRIAPPAFIERKEPAAVYMWLSTRRLIIQKCDEQIDLSMDDLRALRRFFEQFDMEGA